MALPRARRRGPRSRTVEGCTRALLAPRRSRRFWSSLRCCYLFASPLVSSRVAPQGYGPIGGLDGTRTPHIRAASSERNTAISAVARHRDGRLIWSRACRSRAFGSPTLTHVDVPRRSIAHTSQQKRGARPADGKRRRGPAASTACEATCCKNLDEMGLPIGPRIRGGRTRRVRSAPPPLGAATPRKTPSPPPPLVESVLQPRGEKTCSVPKARPQSRLSASMAKWTRRRRRHGARLRLPMPPLVKTREDTRVLADYIRLAAVAVGNLSIHRRARGVHGEQPAPKSPGRRMVAVPAPAAHGCIERQPPSASGRVSGALRIHTIFSGQNYASRSCRSLQRRWSTAVRPSRVVAPRATARVGAVELVDASAVGARRRTRRRAGGVALVERAVEAGPGGADGGAKSPISRTGSCCYQRRLTRARGVGRPRACVRRSRVRWPLLWCDGREWEAAHSVRRCERVVVVRHVFRECTRCSSA